MRRALSWAATCRIRDRGSLSRTSTFCPPSPVRPLDGPENPLVGTSRREAAQRSPPDLTKRGLRRGRALRKERPRVAVERPVREPSDAALMPIIAQPPSHDRAVGVAIDDAVEVNNLNGRRRVVRQRSGLKGADDRAGWQEPHQ